MNFLRSLLAQFTIVSFPFLEICVEPQEGQEEGDFNLRKNSMTAGIFFWSKPNQKREKVQEDIVFPVDNIFRDFIFGSNGFNIRKSKCFAKSFSLNISGNIFGHNDLLKPCRNYRFRVR